MGLIVHTVIRYLPDITERRIFTAGGLTGQLLLW